MLLLLDSRRTLVLLPGEGGSALAPGGKGLSRCGVTGPVAEPTDRVLCRVVGRLGVEVRKLAVAEACTGAIAALATMADGSRLEWVVSRRIPVLSCTRRFSSAC